MNIAQETLKAFNNDSDLLKKAITDDESFVYGYDIETKAQSSQWKRPEVQRPKKAHQVRPNVEVLLTVFFYSNGVLNHKLFPQGSTVNKEYYFEFMHRLRETIRQKRTKN